DTHAALEGAGVGSLDNAAIGNGIAIRETDFDGAAAAPCQLPHEIRRGGKVRVARRNKRNERFSSLGAQRLKKGIDRVHDKSSVGGSVLALALSVREELTSSTLPLMCRILREQPVITTGVTVGQVADLPPTKAGQRLARRSTTCLVLL